MRGMYIPCIVPLVCNGDMWRERLNVSNRQKEASDDIFDACFLCVKFFSSDFFHCDIIYHRVSEGAMEKVFLFDIYWKQLTYGVAYQNIISNWAFSWVRLRIAVDLFNNLFRNISIRLSANSTWRSKMYVKTFIFVIVRKRDREPRIKVLQFTKYFFHYFSPSIRDSFVYFPKST